MILIQIISAASLMARDLDAASSSCSRVAEDGADLRVEFGECFGRPQRPLTNTKTSATVSVASPSQKGGP
jgi:hypothetical protein